MIIELSILFLWLSYYVAISASHRWLFHCRLFQCNAFLQSFEDSRVDVVNPHYGQSLLSERLVYRVKKNILNKMKFTKTEKIAFQSIVSTFR